MQDIVVAIALGAASGGILILATRIPLLAWVSLAPLGLAMYIEGPVLAGVAGLLTGVLALGPGHWGRFGVGLIGLMSTFTGIVWAATTGLGAWLWPDGEPAWGALIMPAAAVIASGFARRTSTQGYGAPPRWSTNLFLGSQERWLPVVHIARLGSDLVIPAVLAATSAIPVVLLVRTPPALPSIAAAIACSVVSAAALAVGVLSYRRAVRDVEAGETMRVAAVSVDEGPAGQGYRDVALAITRYEPQVHRASIAGARLIVLPENAVVVTSSTRGLWLDALGRWAREAHARVISGLLDTDLHKNQLVAADESGSIAVTYDKQHPMIGVEDRRQVQMPPALLAVGPVPVSGVICVDLDYGDMIRPVARAGGLLAVPSNDWREFAEIHHRSAVWSVVMAGVPTVRAVGHGISAVFDAAGRVLARQSSFDGPVALIADVPVPRPRRGTAA